MKSEWLTPIKHISKYKRELIWLMHPGNSIELHSQIDCFYGLLVGFYKNWCGFHTTIIVSFSVLIRSALCSALSRVDLCVEFVIEYHKGAIVAHDKWTAILIIAEALKHFRGMRISRGKQTFVTMVELWYCSTFRHMRLWLWIDAGLLCYELSPEQKRSSETWALNYSLSPRPLCKITPKAKWDVQLGVLLF